MTFVEEFTPDEENQLEEVSNYPSAFGITFTPLISGITLAVLGFAASIYIVVYNVFPAQKQYQTLKTSKQEKEAKIGQQESSQLQARIKNLETELKKIQEKKPEILEVLESDEGSDTLLIDLNGFIEGRKAELLSFRPIGKEEVIRDGSLGNLVNGKLKRQRFNVSVEGNFAQIQSILSNLERLQSLLLVKNLNLSVKGSRVLLFDGTELISEGEPNLATNFTLEALFPLEGKEVSKEEQPAK